MAPAYEYNPGAVQASFTVLPKGEYEFTVGEPKSFMRQAGVDKHDSFGLRFPLIVEQASDPSLVGEKVYFSTYFQSAGGLSFAKQFFMAVNGYGKGRNEEQRYNKDMADEDFKFEPGDGGYIGEGFMKMKGMRVIGNLDVQKNPETGDESQNFKGWRHITSGPISG